MKLEIETEVLEIVNAGADYCTPACLEYLEAAKRAFPDVDDHLLTEIVKRIFRNLSTIVASEAHPDPVITPIRSFPKTEFKHPVHKWNEWNDADFERLWRFDELDVWTETLPFDEGRVREDWSHPAHTKSIIPPPSQTGVVWREMGLHGDERRLYFHHTDADDSANLTDIPSVLRCQEPGYLSLGSTRDDVRMEIENSREFVKALVEMYEQDWQTQAERLNCLGLIIKKKTTAQQHPDFSAAHTQLRILYKYDRKLSEPTEELKAEWEEKLKQYDLQEIEIELPPKAQRQEWSENDEDVRDSFEGLRITNEGVRETAAPVSERKEEFPKWRKLVNPYDLSQEEWEGPQSEQEKEQFAILTAKNLTEFHNTPLEEAAALTGQEITPNALSKRFERIGNKRASIDWSRAVGNYYCLVVLSGRPELKILAPMDAPFIQACDTFMEKMRASKLQAAKKERRKKDKTRLTERIQAASNRIQQAYAGSFIYRADSAFWCPPEGTVVTHSSY